MAPDGALGAVVLGAFYLVVAVLCIPGIVAAPLIYNNWGNFSSNSLSPRER